MASRMKISAVADSMGVQPLRTLLYGPEKVGKTTEAAKADGVVAIDVEGRMGHISVPKFPMVTDWDEIMEALDELAESKHPYKNVLIDSVSAVEKLLKRKIMKESGWSAEAADEFGRWQKLAISSYWPDLFTKLERLEREKGMGSILTAHLMVKNMKNPSGEPYDRFRPGISGDRGPELFLHWCHDVLYVAYDDLIRIEKRSGKERIRTSTSGDRVVYTKHAPSYDAGNSCGLPDPMSFSWAEYVRCREEGLSSLPTVLKRIGELIPQIKDESVRERVRDYARSNAGNVTTCRQIASRCAEIIEEQNKSAEVSTAK